MTFRDERRLSLRLPTDIRKWIEHQAGAHKTTLTDYTLQLIAKGIQAEAIDDTVTRIQQASQAGPVREMLRQTLAVRYMVEQQARGKVSMTEKISTEALTWADSELRKLYSAGSES